jgi:hypothetical protein
MKIISNDRLIRRNNRIGLAATFIGLIVLGGGMFISFRYPELVLYSLLALLLGFVLSQVGIYYSNRWGRSPRPDEVIDQALKGLDNKYSIYHFSTPVSHLFVGPAGVWILQPHQQRGTISFSKGRWTQKGGNWYLKLFAQEGIGRPDIEVSQETTKLKEFFLQHFDEERIPPINTALVFLNPRVEIDIPEEADPPAETVQIGKLKDFLRKYSRSKSLSMATVEEINRLFSPE